MQQQCALLWSEVLAFPRLGWHLDPKRSEPLASLVRCLGAGRPHRGEACCGPCCPVPRGDPAILPRLLPTPGRGTVPSARSLSVLGGGADHGLERPGEPPRPWRGRAAPSLQRMSGSQGVDTASVAIGPSGQLSSLDSRGLHLENTDLAASSSIHADHAFCLTLGNFWIKPWLPSWMLWVSFWR